MPDSVTMDGVTRVLFVEDQQGDVVLARRALEQGGLEFIWRCVATEAELEFEIRDFGPDIILCDYALPGYSGDAALHLAQLLCPATPFVFVSGMIREEIAIACLKCGATDYVLKSNLRRLGPAVRRAVVDSRERKRMLEVEQSQRRLGEVLEASSDMVMMSDPNGRITFVNDAACRLLGESRQQLLGTEWDATYVSGSRGRMRYDVRRRAIQNGSWEGEIAIAAHDGAAIATSQVVIAHKDADGKTRFFSTIGRDLRDRKDFEARIHRLVNYDTLTGLPNHAHMNDLVRRLIGRARRDCGVFALVTVNLDGFRLVDEAFGRELGDELLKSVSASLKTAVREGGAVARVGPDEFLVILSDLVEPVEAGVLVRRLLDSICIPRSFAGQDVQITASAGIAIYPNDGTDFETLLRNANAAMHEVKSRSHGGLQFHSGDVELHAKQQLRLETGLRNAILQHQLILHYQPQFELHSGRLCGIEALARWFRSDGEAVAPAVFIPLAEHTGLIAALGEWVLNEACETVATWQGLGEEPPTLCINVSAHQICDEFSSTIARVIELTGFPAERLELEITESVLITNPELVLKCLAQWKRLGVRIAVDDFGTGYSSLSYLSVLPVDRLKLDKSLIQSMTLEPKDAAIIRAVISLGQELGVAVIAEGVETEQQLEMLNRLGCQQVQGYLFAPPMCAAEARTVMVSMWGARGTLNPPAARTVSASRHAS
jgi:diguanylate cyclase (GGDEF)-like protein/PAS domain S-box-containing protein